jgi:predicted membrane protein
MQFVVGISTLSTSGRVGMRPFMLILLVVAVVLIFIGCGIALLSLKHQRKDQVAFITVENPDSRAETP